MTDLQHTTVRIQNSLGSIADGSGITMARHELLDSAIVRIRKMVRQEIGRHPTIARWEEEDDLVQEVLIRVDKAVQDARPEHIGQFFIIVGQHVRWAAIDLIRRHYGAHGIGQNHQTGIEPARQAGPNSDNPDRIDPVRLHEAVDELDEDIREVWILHVYSGITHEAIAGLTGVSTKTVQRKITKAKFKLAELLEPGSGSNTGQGD